MILAGIKQTIYTSNIWLVIIICLIIPIVWGVIGRVLRHKTKHSIKKEWRVLNVVFAIISAFIIVLMTLVNRDTTTQVLYLNPLKVIFDAEKNIEAIRTFTMNIVLFMPLGASLVFVVSKHRSVHPVIRTVLICFIFSFIIEILQLTLELGVAETDDVIANTFGALIGTIAYPVCYYHKGHRKHHSSEHEHHHSGEHHSHEHHSSSNPEHNHSSEHHSHAHEVTEEEKSE